MIDRRGFLLGSAGAAGRAAARPKDRPHIVLFISDDHAFPDSPPYGNRGVRTPTLERMATAGTVFTGAFAGSPTCVPSRAIIMTGLMSARNGAEPNHSRLRPGVRTLPSYLREAGYRVAHFGKGHFAPPASYADWEDVPSEIKGAGPLDSDLDTAAVQRWLAARDPADKRPLCLVVGSHSPHVYWMDPEGYDPAHVDLPPTFVDTPETRLNRAKYYTEITKMDRQLGEVYDAVRRHLGDNTLFVYTTDNGPQWPFAKWNLYDAGIHLPLMATWPGVVKAGARSDAMLSFADFLPTFIELAGGRVPEGLDGQSFARVLRGSAKRHRDRIFATHSGDGNMNVYPMRAVRTGRYKYIRNLHPEFEYTTHIDKGGVRDGKDYWDSWVRRAESDPAAAAIVRRYHQRPGEELYDLAADPYEQKNLAGDARHAAELARLRGDLDRWIQAQGDRGQVFGTARLLQP